MSVDTLHIDLELRPSQALSERGFRRLMVIAFVVSLTIGTAFLIKGAWPVFGFFGLDVLLLYWAFRVNRRALDRSEHIRLDDREFRVERYQPARKPLIWRFDPTWLKVIFEPRAGQAPRLSVRSHGKSLTIGTFLPPEEREEVAEIIDEGLRRRRNHLAEQGDN
ncbi:MAG: DUF2244 domain-containing protein [Pseudomonadota bacterium]